MNGNGNGHTARQLPAATEIVEQQPNDDSHLVDELFSEIPAAQRTMLFGMLAGRNKGLADRLKARAAKVGSKDE